MQKINCFSLKKPAVDLKSALFKKLSLNHPASANFFA